MEQLYKRIVYDTLLAECEKMKTLHKLYKNYDKEHAKALYGNLKGYRYQMSYNCMINVFKSFRYILEDYQINHQERFKELYISKNYEVIVFKKCNLEQLKHYQEEIAKDYVHFKMIDLHYTALLILYIKYIDELIEEKQHEGF
jgi:hypothetical protein